MERFVVKSDSTVPGFYSAGWFGGREFQRLGCFLITIIFVCALVGCDSGASAPRHDPAMEAQVLEASTAQTQDTVTSEKAVQPVNVPRREDGRIFFPQTGWVEETSFWDMYENRPEQIPHDLDLYTAHLLKEEFLRETSNAGET